MAGAGATPSGHACPVPTARKSQLSDGTSAARGTRPGPHPHPTTQWDHGHCAPEGQGGKLCRPPDPRHKGTRKTESGFKASGSRGPQGTPGTDRHRRNCKAFARCPQDPLTSHHALHHHLWGLVSWHSHSPATSQHCLPLGMQELWGPFRWGDGHRAPSTEHPSPASVRDAAHASPGRPALSGGGKLVPRPRHGRVPPSGRTASPGLHISTHRATVASTARPSLSLNCHVHRRRAGALNGSHRPRRSMPRLATWLARSWRPLPPSPRDHPMKCSCFPADARGSPRLPRLTSRAPPVRPRLLRLPFFSSGPTPGILLGPGSGWVRLQASATERM